jgi:hypothetical protein
MLSLKGQWDSVGQGVTLRPRQYFSRDAPRASAKTMGDVIQKWLPRRFGPTIDLGDLVTVLRGKG